MIQVPIVWPVAAPIVWAAWVFGVIAVILALRVWLDLPSNRVAGLRSSALWTAVCLGCVWLRRYDPTPVSWLRGSLPLGWGAILVLGLAAWAGWASMRRVGKNSRLQIVFGRFLVHISLILGSIVFAIPFAWLLVTSFKEDVDMASPHGIVWIPKVTKTVPYVSPENPLYRAVYQGQSVEANRAFVMPDGRWQMAVERPLGLAGFTFEVRKNEVVQIPRNAPLVTTTVQGRRAQGKVVQERENGARVVELDTPPELAGKRLELPPNELRPVREFGLRWQNYPEALDYLPPEANRGLTYLRNSTLLVVLNVLGTLLSCSLVAYAFARLRFPGRNALFAILLATMMLPGAVTLLPQFLIFRELGWVDTLYPLWVPALFAGAFNVFLLRQFFRQIPLELEDAAKIDGCDYLKAFWKVMLPQVRPALAVIAVWTFIGAWNNFMGPLIYINSPEHLPIAYALQLFNGERSGEPGLLMAFASLSMLPVVLVFVFAQRYFIEGVTLSGMGGR
ncbi:MAG: carbohydrate ABC transporter permease [Fimbriimonadaceae bacterium]|nr:carbohydrate ABC transporter permease [Fimbriimonadaceae bacterium]